MCLRQAQRLPRLDKINSIPLHLSPILQFLSSTPPHTSDYASIYSESSDSTPYTILLDSGITIEQSYGKLIKSGRDGYSPT